MAVRIHADAVLTLTDGFTGRPLESGGAVVTMDGAPCSPVRKPGGVLVIVNSSAGEHELTVTLPHFQPERLTFAADGGTASISAILTPSDSYPLPADAVRAYGRAFEGDRPLSEGELLFGIGAAPLKLAQDKAAPGDTRIMLFSGRGELRFPAELMFSGRDPERVRVISEEGELAAPLEKSHRRGEGLLPVRTVTTDSEGRFYLCLPAPGEAAFFCREGKKWLKGHLTLESGENRDKDIVFGK